jgi:hypothetical protein
MKEIKRFLVIILVDLPINFFRSPESPRTEFTYCYCSVCYVCYVVLTWCINNTYIFKVLQGNVAKNPPLSFNVLKLFLFSFSHLSELF